MRQRSRSFGRAYFSVPLIVVVITLLLVGCSPAADAELAEATQEPSLAAVEPSATPTDAPPPTATATATATLEPTSPALEARMRAVAALRAAGRCTLPSTIGAERATNPFLRPGSPSIREALGLNPSHAHEEVFAAARALKDTGAYRHG